MREDIRIFNPKYLVFLIVAFAFAIPAYGQKRGRAGTLQLMFRDGKSRELSFGTSSTITISGIHCDSLLVGSEWVRGLNQIVPIPCDSMPTSVVEKNNLTHLDLLELAVYPNPSYGEVKFVVNSAMGELKNIQVFSVLGVLIHQFEMTHSTKALTEISWDNKNSGGIALPSGTYIVRVVSQRGTVARLIEILN